MACSKFQGMENTMKYQGTLQLSLVMLIIVFLISVTQKQLSDPVRLTEKSKKGYLLEQTDGKKKLCQINILLLSEYMKDAALP